MRIISKDVDQRRIGLSIRSPQDDPIKKFKVGDSIKGVVKNVESYGAFVEIAPGVTGLVHIKEIGWGYISNIYNEVKVGEEVKVKIIAIDLNKRNFSLSMKQA